MGAENVHVCSVPGVDLLGWWQALVSGKVMAVPTAQRGIFLTGTQGLAE